MERKPALSELLKYIRILILDDEDSVGLPVQMRLQQNGYPHVKFYHDPEAAWDELKTTNILLIDHYLGYSPKTGMEFTKAAKEEFGDNLDVILYSGSVENLAQHAMQAGATACLEKPLKFEYLILWIEETAKRIWLEKTLDAIPDELIVIDPREEQFGKIHYVNKTKKVKFEKGQPLEYDYCWRRFERKEDGKKPCYDCISRNAKTRGGTVRSYRTYEAWDGHVATVDIHAAPIRDQVGEIRGIIETCRDRTQREVMENSIMRIETEPDWAKRLDLFLQGFVDLGFSRVRFYKRDNNNEHDVYRGIRQRGMPKDFRIQDYNYEAKYDKPTEIISRDCYATLFLVLKGTGHDWVPSTNYTHVYKVDDSLVPNNHILTKEKWIDIPVLANREIIAKVSVEPKDANTFISNYELEILNHYADWAGQLLVNAEHRQKLELKEKTNQLIIQMNQRISRMPMHNRWIYLALKRVCEVLNTSSCTLFLLEGKGRQARLVRKTSFARDIHEQKSIKIKRKEEYRVGQYVVGSVFKSGRSRAISNLSEIAERQRVTGKKEIDLDAYDYYSERIGEPLKNVMCVVLRTRKGKMGVIRTLNKRQPNIFGNYEFTRDDRRAFEALAGQISVAYETATLIEELQNSQKLKEFITQEYSHTLKNLMQPVVSIAGLLKLDPEDQELWSLLSNEIIKMKTTINTMLQLVKMESASLNLQKSLVNVRTLLNNVTKPYEIVAADKNQTIKLTVDDSVVPLYFDETLVYDAVANLLDNAIKYAKEGTYIHIVSRIKYNKLFISVTDIGEPIPPEDRVRIFEKDYIGKNVVDKVHQLGLGLTYVKVVTEAHGGKVYVDPRFKNGAKIVMTFPAQTEEEENHEKHSDH